MTRVGAAQMGWGVSHGVGQLTCGVAAPIGWGCSFGWISSHNVVQFTWGSLVFWSLTWGMAHVGWLSGGGVADIGWGSSLEVRSLIWGGMAHRSWVCSYGMVKLTWGWVDQMGGAVHMGWGRSHMVWQLT